MQDNLTAFKQFQSSQRRADIAEQFLNEHKCSKTKIKIKLALKTPQIIRIEDSNISSEQKVRKLKALYPKDTCWHRYVESEY